MLAALKQKGREVLVLLTAVSVLLAAAMPMIGDMLLILVVGACGWFLSDPAKPAGK